MRLNLLISVYLGSTMSLSDSTMPLSAKEELNY